ncbi:MAG: helix-turn-helix domain-containing protein [Gemmatimonadetes bacterium]|nr:helix-turn-helix domain-containing protein [Gemmatimonadota bacterium]
MQKSVTPATFGALVRDARTAAGISQSELGERIGASRFWVAQFEKGKPSAELGLALKAVQALGLAVRVEAHGTSAATAQRRTRKTRSAGASPLPPVDLGEIIAALTVAPGTRSNTEWPSVVAGRRTRKRS